MHETCDQDVAILSEMPQFLLTFVVRLQCVAGKTRTLSQLLACVSWVPNVFTEAAGGG